MGSRISAFHYGNECITINNKKPPQAATRPGTSNNIFNRAAGGRAPTRFESCEGGGTYEYIRGTYDYTDNSQLNCIHP